MEPAQTERLDENLIDKLRKAAYIHFGKDEILALEELIRRYRRAISKRTSVERVHEDDSAG